MCEGVAFLHGDRSAVNAPTRSLLNASARQRSAVDGDMPIASFTCGGRGRRRWVAGSPSPSQPPGSHVRGMYADRPGQWRSPAAINGCRNAPDLRKRTGTA